MLETYVVHITKTCNCKCVYCYETDRESQYEWPDIKKLLDNIVKYNKEFNIEFLGGEPCLRTDLIKKVIEYAPQASGFTITTNGTIVNDELIGLLRQHQNLYWVASIDGHHFANVMRTFNDGTNTHNTVIANLKELLSSGIPKSQMGCHLTTHPYNVAYIFDSVKHLYDEGFRGFGIGTVESTMLIDERYCNSFKSQMMKLSRHIHSGLLPDIQVQELMHLKPADDQRHYIKDGDGKTVLETYGRSNNDIISQDIDGININRVTSNMEDTIIGLRQYVYDYHQSYKKVFGCGTGRCGSKTLAKQIAYDNKFNVGHEVLNLSWNYNDEQYDDIVNMDCNMVASGLINYASRLLGDITCEFICIKRNKQDFIDSFMEAHQLNESNLWTDIPNPSQFPSFNHDVLVLDGLDMYWEMYYNIADELDKSHDNFKIVEFGDLIKRAVPEVNRNLFGFYDYGDKFVETLI